MVMAAWLFADIEAAEKEKGTFIVCDECPLQRGGDKTAIELFVGGLRGWEAGLRRRMNDGTLSY
jgi:hypothetical protein